MSKLSFILLVSLAGCMEPPPEPPATDRNSADFRPSPSEPRDFEPLPNQPRPTDPSQPGQWIPSPQMPQGSNPPPLNPNPSYDIGLNSGTPNNPGSPNNPGGQGVSFQRDVYPILSSSQTGRVYRCTVCHRGYTDYSVVKEPSRIAAILSRVGPQGNMPPRTTHDALTPADIQVLQNWQAQGYQP